jgi:hypothetical protein
MNAPEKLPATPKWKDASLRLLFLSLLLVKRSRKAKPATSYWAPHPKSGDPYSSY